MKNHLFWAACLLLSLLYASSCSTSYAPERSSAEAAPSEAAALPDTVLPADRVVIKTAELSMEVKELEPAVHAFQELLQPMGGKIYHYELEKQLLSSTETDYKLDSTLQVRSISPTGQLKIRVPVQYGDSFIAAVLLMDASVSRFYFDEQDITEDITEQKELMLSETGKGKRTSSKDRVASDDQETYIQRKADFSKMAYRTKHLWFDVRLNGQTYTERTMLPAMRSVRSPFYVRAFQALQDGWYGFSVFLIALMHGWPFILLAALVYAIIRRMRGTPMVPRP